MACSNATGQQHRQPMQSSLRNLTQLISKHGRSYPNTTALVPTMNPRGLGDNEEKVMKGTTAEIFVGRTREKISY